MFDFHDFIVNPILSFGSHFEFLRVLSLIFKRLFVKAEGMVAYSKERCSAGSESSGSAHASLCMMKDEKCTHNQRVKGLLFKHSCGLSVVAASAATT
ncbi:MAG: hypothetical protein IPL08_14295 [Saprospiraceae bacterium]|nr:hypothetical protein [Saprospiraceae bacterium]